jgi:hypothetical protein
LIKIQPEKIIKKTPATIRTKPSSKAAADWKFTEKAMIRTKTRHWMPRYGSS